MKIPVRDTTGSVSRFGVIKSKIEGYLKRFDNSPSKPKPKPVREAAELLKPAAKNATKTVEIRLTVPEIPRLPSYKQFGKNLLKLVRKSPRKTAVLGVAIVVVISGFVLLMGRNDGDNSGGSSAQSQGPPKLTKGTPDYPTILPAGKNIESLGGWTRISPPDRDPVYTYVDKIDKVQINVSEQPLPANFKRDTTNTIAKLATELGAANKITAGDTTVHLSTAEVGKSQSVVFTKSDLLILIRSNSYIADDQWVNYINSLR